jgi:hypothetical protein
VGARSLTAKPSRTGAWDKFEIIDLGRVEVEKPGELTVKVRARDASTWKAINLRWVKLTRGE